MLIPAAVREYLRRKGGEFREHVVPAMDNFARAIEEARLPSEHVAQATVVSTGTAALMVIHPVSHEPDMKALESLFHRTFGPCRPQELRRIFHDCDLEALPPLPAAYGMKAVVDASLAGADEIYFPAGRAGIVVRASGKEFARLTEGAWQRPVAKPRQRSARRHMRMPAEMREDMRAQRQVPRMPEIALQLFKLRDNPYSNASELAAIVEQDENLEAMILGYASSPMFGGAKVDSLSVAIGSVLGMDFVMELALGLVLGKSFRNPPPTETFWRHGFWTAALAHALCMRIPYLRRPSSGKAYVAAFMHNFGLLLRDRLCPDQSQAIRLAVEQQKDASLVDTELEVLGVTHMDLGVWIMEEWGMPQEIVESVREHHNPDFRSDFSAYANLVYIANTLLKRHGIGDAEHLHVPPEILEAVGLDQGLAEAALGEVVECSDNLEFMTGKMLP